MFRFSLNGVECSCDSSDELRSVVLGGQAKPKRAKPKATKAATDEAAAIRLASPVGNAEFPPDAELPLIDGPISWDRVDKTIKKLGLNADEVDKRAFRSALKRRQEIAA